MFSAPGSTKRRGSGREFYCGYFQTTRQAKT
jgi:hypothetical protein